MLGLNDHSIMPPVVVLVLIYFENDGVRCANATAMEVYCPHTSHYSLLEINYDC